MLLSIGMIVKNEEKNLDRCLSALKPILENIDSELIIADTGSEDNTVEIAKKYTDNVFYFEWINDFAAARNSTLDRATGEWFMFVDADEFFQNCEPLIDFFNSGEYKKYNAATFITRSYGSVAMDTYSDFNAPRLSKIFPETRFEFAIHEGYNIFNSPIKILDLVADHIGYIHDDDDDTAKKKCERNYPLLLKRLETEKDPKSLLYMQLFEARFETNEEEALEYLDIGLKRSLEEKSSMVAAFYKKKASYEYNHKRYESAMKLCDDYLNITDRSIKPGPTGTDAELTGFKAHLYDCLGRYSDAVSEFIKFFRYYKDYRGGKLDTNDLLMYELHYISKDKFHINMCEFLSCCVKAKKYNTALEYLKLMPVSKYPDAPAFISDRIKNEVIIAENTNFKNFKSLYEQVKDGKYIGFFYRYVRARIFSSDKKADYVAKIKPYFEKNAEYDILEIIEAYFRGKDVSAETAEFASANGTADYPELLYLLIAENKDILPLKKCSDFAADKLSFSCSADYEGFYDVLAAYDMSECSDECCEDMASIVRTAIVQAENEKLSAVKLLNAYGRTGKRLAGSEDDESLSKDVRGALTAASLIECFDKRDFKGCIACMRKLLHIFPEFKAVINEYQQIIKNAAGIGAQNENQNSLSSMAAVVKRNIRNMLKSNNISEAEKTLSELEKLVPDDPDIQTLRSEISAYSG
ncbi:MAG: glycosyltransferase [Huintestinicola sp.]|uniref:glycosyltransferase n=1 Tax=Huintestinicola sp. TaxID=2981661 RepID=UPI003F09F348